MTPKHGHPQRGFSLVELTIVLVIVALLSGGLMLGLAAQRDANNYQEAQRQLDSAKEALFGFAISNGRLPCPATATLANTDSNAGKENCTAEHGVLPWSTLGLPETDPWGQRLTYFARNQFTATLTAGALAMIWAGIWFYWMQPRQPGRWRLSKIWCPAYWCYR